MVRVAPTHAHWFPVVPQDGQGTRSPPPHGPHVTVPDARQTVHLINREVFAERAFPEPPQLLHRPRPEPPQWGQLEVPEPPQPEHTERCCVAVLRLSGEKAKGSSDRASSGGGVCLPDGPGARCSARSS